MLFVDAEKFLGGMRVIKSRFGSSKCAECGEIIDPGVTIARDKDYKARGGWMHLNCAVSAAKRSHENKPRKRRKRA